MRQDVHQPLEIVLSHPIEAAASVAFKAANVFLRQICFTWEVSASVITDSLLKINLEKLFCTHWPAKCWYASFCMGGVGVEGRAAREVLRETVGRWKAVSLGAPRPESALARFKTRGGVSQQGGDKKLLFQLSAGRQLMAHSRNSLSWAGHEGHVVCDARKIEARQKHDRLRMGGPPRSGKWKNQLSSRELGGM